MSYVWSSGERVSVGPMSEEIEKVEIVKVESDPSNPLGVVVDAKIIYSSTLMSDKTVEVAIAAKPVGAGGMPDQYIIGTSRITAYRFSQYTPVRITATVDSPGEYYIYVGARFVG